MPTAIGINGFGRIGRLVMRAALENPDGESFVEDDLYLLGYRKRQRVVDRQFCDSTTTVRMLVMGLGKGKSGLT